jgi:hypothetical protein
MINHHAWDERYTDLLDCYGSEWLDITLGMDDEEVEVAAGFYRSTFRYACWQFSVAWGEFVQAYIDTLRDAYLKVTGVIPGRRRD